MQYNYSKFLTDPGEAVEETDKQERWVKRLKGAIMSRTEEKRYEGLSPFELKNKLIQIYKNGLIRILSWDLLLEGV